jgi:ABC-type bacteriocin/lantibiotic exporter with double-glycine peptidase domain
LTSRSWGLSLLILSLISPLNAAAQAPSLKVPFYPDQTDQCGPATLAGVLGYWGKPIEPKQLRQEMYEAKLHGTLPMDLVYAAKTHGLTAETVRGNLQFIQSEIQAGRPVLVVINRGYTILPVNHFMIITGFDDGRKGLIVHSGKRANQFMSYRKFLKQWEKTDYWAMKAHA